MRQTIWLHGGHDYAVVVERNHEAGKASVPRGHAPTDEEILKGIAGNTCRCTGYQNIMKSIRAAAEEGR